MGPTNARAVDVEALLEQVEGVRRLARALVRDADDAEDVAQDALVLAVTRPPGQEWALSAWLRGVVRNVARDRRRGDRRRRAREGKGARPEPVTDDAGLLLRHEMQKKVLAHVTALAPDERSVVLLRYVEDQPVAEIARCLDVPLETVKTRLRRALAKLRATLDAEHGGDRRAWAALLPLAADPPPPVSVPAGPAALRWTPSLPQVATALALAGAGAAIWVGSRGAEDGTDRAGPAGLVADANPPAPGAKPPEGEPADARGLEAGGRRPSPALSGTTRGVRATGLAHVGADPDLDLRGYVVRADGTALAEGIVAAFVHPWARIQGASAEQGRIERQVARDVLRADGSFVLRLERGVEVTLRVEGPGLARQEIEHLQAGQAVRVVMEPAAVLVIEARDAEGSALAGAEIEVWREIVNTAQPLLTPWRGITQPDGTMRVFDVQVGVRVGVGGRHPAWASPDTVRTRDVGAGENRVVLVFSRGRTLVGRVVDAVTGRPIAGARLATDWNVGSSWIGHPATSDADGRFEVTGWSERVLGRLGADAYGYRHGEVSVVVSEPLEIRLQPGSTVLGRVVSADGAPLAGVAVGAWPSDAWDRAEGRSTVTANDGLFRLDGVDGERPNSLTFVSTGWARSTLDVPALEGPGRERDVGDVRLARPLRLEGLVATKEGTPVPGAQVLLSGGGRERGRLFAGSYSTGLDGDSRVTDDRGRFAFAALEPGQYSVSASTPEGTQEGPVDVALTSSDVLDVKLTVPVGRRLMVRVRDTWGAIVKCPFEVRLPSGPPLRGEIGEEGLASLQVPTDAGPIVVDAAWASEHGFRAGAPTLVLPPISGWPVEVKLEFAQGIAGRVLGPDGAPLEGAVLLFRGDGRWSTATTDERGAFRVPWPRDVVGSVELTGEVRPPASRSPNASKSAPAGETTRRAIGGRIDGVRADALDLELRAQALDVDRVLPLLVLDPDGQPASGLEVRLEGTDAVATTDATGRVRLEGLVAREVRVQILPAASRLLRAWIPPAKDVVLPRGEEVVMRLRRPAHLEGVVLDPSDRPVPGAQVAVSQAPQSSTIGTTDAEGKFSIQIDPDLWFPLRVGAYRAAQGVGSLHGDLKLTSLPSSPVTVRLSR